VAADKQVASDKAAAAKKAEAEKNTADKVLIFLFVKRFRNLATLNYIALFRNLYGAVNIWGGVPHY
jgi:hypothetical protein